MTSSRRSVPRKTRLALTCIALATLLTAAPGDDAKIEKKLLAALSSDEEATAPFFLVFGEKPDLSQAGKIKNKTERGKFVAQSLKDTAEKSQNGVRGYLQGHKIAFTPFWVENKIYIPNGTLDLARDLAKKKEVVAIIPEEVYPTPQPQAGGGSIQAVEWGIAKIRADQVWPTTQGAGMVVANIDTGVQYTHPALLNQYRGKNGAVYTHQGNWYDPTGTYPSSPGDNNGHGTHTMGTMVGSDGSNQIGVAPGAKWMACKGCGTSSCAGSSLIACAQWVLDPLGNASSGSFALQPDVVNNSWGGGSGSTWYQSYIDNWRSAGIFPAFSAGNSGPGCNTANSPGDNPTAFASGATASNDTIASFSSRGPSAFGAIKPDVSAPGSSIRSSVPTNGYEYYSGTSMASPHTAGVVALLWAAAPAGYQGNIASTEQLLRSTAVKLTTTENCGGTAGVSPNNTFGYGRIDALAAVQGAGTPPNQPPSVDITSPLSGAQFNCGGPVTFTGTASDPPSLNLTGSIVWTEGSTSLGTGGSVSPTFACTSNPSELHTVYAAVTDSNGASASDSVTVTIVNNAIPAAPTNLGASVSSRVVTLTWSWAGSGGSGYRVERKPKSSGTWGTVATLTGTTIKTVTNNPPVGQWQYRVFALNGALQSASSNVVSARVR